MSATFRSAERSHAAALFGYDANRLQLTSRVATKSGGPTGGLMNLTYGYQASAGQMGAGSTAGNAGQLMTISGTINSTAESAAYAISDWFTNGCKNPGEQ